MPMAASAHSCGWDTCGVEYTFNRPGTNNCQISGAGRRILSQLSRKKKLVVEQNQLIPDIDSQPLSYFKPHLTGLVYNKASWKKPPFVFMCRAELLASDGH